MLIRPGSPPRPRFVTFCTLNPGPSTLTERLRAGDPSSRPVGSGLLPPAACHATTRRHRTRRRHRAGGPKPLPAPCPRLVARSRQAPGAAAGEAVDEAAEAVDRALERGGEV